jgi:hypothetical protein
MFKKLKTTSFSLLLISAIAQPIQSVDAAPKPCFQGASAGYVRPRLKVGVTGRSVATVNHNIRSQPGTNTRVTGSLAPRSTFKVVDGPLCTNGYVWWKVNKNGTQGWVAEADPATFKYWLAPN